MEPFLSSDLKQRSILKNQNNSQLSQSNQGSPVKQEKRWNPISSGSSEDSDTDNDFKLIKDAENMDSIIQINNSKRRSQLPKWQVLAMK